MRNPDFWRDGLRILCVRLDNLGDVVMTSPAFRALKTTWPNCQLTVLTSSAGAAIAEYISEVDNIIRFDVPWVSSDTNARNTLLPLATQLKAFAFDAAIIFTVQSQSPLPTAMLCYLADIPRVLGYCRENPYQLMTDWVPDQEVLMATRHEVERQLDLVKAIGCQTVDQQLSLTIPSADRQYVRNLLAANGCDQDRPWLVLHPGVSETKRQYPADDFAQALIRLRQELGCQLVLTGGANEERLAARIQEQIRLYSDEEPVINLAGQLTIGQLISLLAEAPLLIANNTGPVHMAAAVGTPVVVLYAKTNPQHTPWQIPSRVLYFDVPVGLRSRNVLLQQFPEAILSTASPEAIVQAVNELIAEQDLFSKNDVVCTH
ncbi:glycosyltransferase family 9 protein [Spirosoma litoris]